MNRSAEQLRATEEIALYLEACAAEASGDAVVMARARADVALSVTRHAQPNRRNW